MAYHNQSTSPFIWFILNINRKIHPEYWFKSQNMLSRFYISSQQHEFQREIITYFKEIITYFSVWFLVLSFGLTIELEIKIN